ncbi:unnamed protein product, partial [Mesorhabditis belari]|uniref:Chitinase n=1 Tax=Mesorhabditis belari TaxID=2138241 RepID=A0AAF3EYE6_9BILA
MIYSLLLLLTAVYGVTSFSENEVHRSIRKRGDPNGGFLRPCYFTNWAQYRKPRAKYVPEDYIPGLCTHILFAFGWMKEDFTVKAFDPADLPNDWAGQGMYRRVNALKQKDRGLKTLISIGGWSFGTRLFEEMAKTEAGRKTFIDSSIAFARKWDFDGVDIDWEYPKGPSVKDHFTALINELRAAVEAEAVSAEKTRLLVTAAVSAGIATIDQAYDIPNLAKPFDFVNLMSYDFWGAWDGVVGMNSPLYSRKDLQEPQKHWNVDWAAKHWVEKGMPKEKLLIGIGTYGRGFTVKEENLANPLNSTGNAPAKITEFVQEAGVASYYELCEMVDNGAERHWHVEHQVPYLTKGNQWWSYDDEESVYKKIAYVKKEGFGGAFVWTLDFDDFNGKCSKSNGQPYPLINIIAKELGGVEVRRTLNTCGNKKDGFYKSDTSCSHFILCLEGSAYPMSCPSGLQYSAEKGHCVRPSDSGCVSPLATLPTPPPSISPFTTTSQSTTVGSSNFSCHEKMDGFYPDPIECSRFYRCVSGQSYHFHCSPGTFFNPKSSDCDSISRDICHPKYS